MGWTFHQQSHLVIFARVDNDLELCEEQTDDEIVREVLAQPSESETDSDDNLADCPQRLDVRESCGIAVRCVR